MPYSSGNEEEQSRKLFIGGISLDTTDDGMRAYFSKYGNITDCVVIREQGTNRSKGFGFVTFETEEEADRCMCPSQRPHTIDGRTVDAKRAVSREESSKPGAHVQVKKVFVGGVKQGCDENLLREYFGTFGNIVSVEIPLDRNTQQPKGFGFVTFDDFDVTDKLVAKRHHDVGGFQCEVKKALSKEEMEKAKQQLNMKGQRSSGSRGGSYGGGGRGGGRGRGRGRGGGGSGDGYGGYNNDSYGGGPMRGQYGQSQRSSGGPYGGGYGSGGGGGSGYGGGYSSGGGGGGYNSGGYGGGSGYGSGGYGNSYNSGNSGYDNYGSNNGYGGYGGQGGNYYGDSGGKY